MLDCTRCSRLAARVTPPSQIRQVHISLTKNEMISIIHFSQEPTSSKDSEEESCGATQRSAQYGRRHIMSKGYWIVRVSVRNAERYPEYLSTARPAFEKFGAKFLVRGGRFDSMEGNSRERNVVVEFQDYATALACYRSPEYQAAKAIRDANADADFIIVEAAVA